MRVQILTRHRTKHMNSTEPAIRQVTLDRTQIEEFYVDCFAQEQSQAFEALVMPLLPDNPGTVVDIGGGCGYFARDLTALTGLKVRVIDSDPGSVAACRKHGLTTLEARLGNALQPENLGDESVVCFNLMLHHLVGKSETETRDLQKSAIIPWRLDGILVFVIEYVYESYMGNVSARLIYEITRNTILSQVGKFISRFLPSLRANTFGVGVRFRSHKDWILLFEEAGFELVSSTFGKPDRTSLPRRALLIKEARRDSFVLKPRLPRYWTPEIG